MVRLFLVFVVGMAFIALLTSVVVGRTSATRLDGMEERAQALLDRAEQLLSPPTNGDGETVTRVVIDTFGLSVSLRDACVEDATAVGAAPESATVEVIADGQGPCVGWTLAQYTPEDGGEPVDGWMPSRYLAPS